MTTLDAITQQYVEHEVQIRVLQAKHDDIHKEFGRIDDTFKKIEHQFELINAKIESRTMWLIGLVITSIILPVVLHSLKLV